MATRVIGVQRRFMQLGRVRLGEKGPKGEPKKLGSFRFTSASERLLNHVAAKYGGTVNPWTEAEDAGMFQVTTEATSLDIVLPPTFSEEDGSPTTSYSQWYELWSKGGCVRRCDGLEEKLSAQPCLCDPVKRDAGTDPRGTCGIITRVSFIIPDVPGLGVWRLDSGGWNAAVELPGTLDLLAQAAQESRFIPAVLSLQNRTAKREGKTHRFVVPVIELPDVTIGQLASNTAPTLSFNAPALPDRGKPALPAAPVPPGEPLVAGDDVPFGTPPALPTSTLAEPGSVRREGEGIVRDGMPVAPASTIAATSEGLPLADSGSASVDKLLAEEEVLIKSLENIAVKDFGAEKLREVRAAIDKNAGANPDDPQARVDFLKRVLTKAIEKATPPEVAGE